MGSATPLKVSRDREKGLAVHREMASNAKSAAPYPVDTSPALNSLIRTYEETQEPIAVSFRDMVSWIKVGERATHYVHSYPAKLLPQIAHFFLAARSLAGANDVVLDPFGGTGTVALEAILSGRAAYYADVNPLARLIASAKTSLVNLDEAATALTRIQKSYALSRRAIPPDVVNIEHWYGSATIRQLCRLKAAIDAEPSTALTDLLLVTLSMTARKVSNADPRFSVPVLRKDGMHSPSDAWAVFKDQFAANCRRQRALSAYGNELPKAACVGNDARNLRIPSDGWNVDDEAARLPDNSVGLVITSPPYAGAQKYVRSSSLSLGWLGLVPSAQLRRIEAATIGREHFTKAQASDLILTGNPYADAVIRRVFAKNKTRAAIISAYLREMSDAIAEMARVCRPGGHVALVIGNNDVCGEEFESSTYLAAMFEDNGFDIQFRLVDDIRSRGLITKRHGTAKIITKEWIILLQKRGGGRV